MTRESIKKRRGIELFHVEYSVACPGLGEHHHGADHRRHPCGVGDGLRTNFGETRSVVAGVVDEGLAGLAVLGAFNETADAGLAFVTLPQRAWVRQYRLEKLQRHDLLSVMLNGLDTRHADALENTEMSEVFL